MGWPIQNDLARLAGGSCNFGVWVYLAIVALVLGGCGGVLPSKAETQGGELIDRQGIDIELSPASTQQIILKDTNSTERFCYAPGPDFSVTASEGVSISLGGTTGPGEGLGGEAQRGSLGLGGRNPEVLIARELLFRACELSMNLNTDEETTIKIYHRVLESIERIAQYQAGQGTASVAASPGETGLFGRTTGSSRGNGSDSGSGADDDSNGDGSGGDDDSGGDGSGSDGSDGDGSNGNGSNGGGASQVN